MSRAVWVALWNESSVSLADAMWRACWQGGALVLVLWALCHRWRRMPSSWRCGLWWLVCLKLLAGLSPIFLCLPLLPPRSADTATTRLSRAQPPPYPETVSVRAAAHNRPAFNSNTEPLRTPLQVSDRSWLLAGWLAGACGLAIVTALLLYRLCRILRDSAPLSDPDLLKTAESAAERMSSRTVPRLFVTGRDVGVLTVGLWNPVILLSRQTLDCCSPSELRMVLVHELAHIRRRDVWLGLLPQLTQILFWFHPLAWLACREFCLAREAACDEQTLLSLRAPADRYARLLLKLGARRSAWIPLCTPGVSSHFRNLHRRISMLQHVTEDSPRRVRRGVLLLASLVGAAITVPWTIVSAQNPVRSGAGDSATATGQITSATPLARNAATQDHALKKGSTALAVGLDKKLTSPLKGKPIVSGPPKGRNVDPKSIDDRSVAAKGTPDPKSETKGGITGVPDLIPAAKNSAFTTRIFRLQYASAETLTKSLSTLYDEEVGKTFKLVADLRTKSIVLRANPEKIEEIGRLIRELDNPDATVDTLGAPNIRVIPLNYVQALDIVQTLTKLFADQAPSDVKIIPVERTNSIIVQASQDKFEEIVNVLRKLDISK